MPGFITHYLIGDIVSSALADSKAGMVISNNRHMFNMGTQGPDFLFYYTSLRPSNSARGREIGNMLHDAKTGEFIASLIKYAAGCNKVSEREALWAYIMGYVCHYSLDCHTHPYIYCRAGFDSNDKSYVSYPKYPKYKYTFYHRTFETWIDFLMLQRIKQLKPSELNPASLITLGKDNARAAGAMYECALQETYSVDFDAHRVTTAFKDIWITVILLKDRYGIKKKLFAAIENLLNISPAVSSMIHPVTGEQYRNLDFLNLDKKPWFLPWDQEALHTESFPELFSKAAEEAVRICRLTERWVQAGSQLNMPAVVYETGSRSFSTGLDCRDKKEFRYFDCIFDNSHFEDRP